MTKRNLLKFSLGQKDVCAGVEITQHIATLVQFSGGKSRYVLQRAGIAKIPNGTIKDNIVENQKQLGGGLRQLRKNSKTNANHSIMAIPNKLVITKQTRTAKELTEYQLSKRANLEASRLFTGLDKDLLFDYTQEKIHDQDGKTTNNIVMVAARRQYVDPYLSALSQAELTAKIVDVNCYALSRAFTLVIPQLHNDDLSQNVALINLDICSILINVMKNKNLVYCHNQHFNGTAFESAVNSKLGIAADEQHHATDEEHRQLSVQVQRALQFFFSENKDHKISKILLSGQLATIDGVDKSIEKTTEIPTLIANPFLNVKYANNLEKAHIEPMAPAFMVSSGLALRGI